MARKRKREGSIVEKVFVQSFFTTVLSTMAFCIGPMVDGMMIGNFMSTDSVAAYGLVGPSIFIFSTVGAVIAGGARNIVSRLIGDGNLDKGNKAFSLAFFHSISISAVMVLITILFSRHITILLGARGSLSELIEPARLYLIGYALGVPASNASKVLSSFMQMDGDGKRVINSVIVMTIVDVIGDILVVFAFSGGMLGMGIATSVGNYFSLAVLLMHFTKKNTMLRLNFRNLPWRRTREMVWSGLPVGISRISNTINGLTVNHLLAIFATSNAVAAYGVQRSVDSLFNVFYLGAAETVWILSSIYYGEEDKNALKELIKVTYFIATPIIILIAFILLIGSSFFTRIYLNVSNPAAFAMATGGVRWLAIALPMLLASYCFDDYLMGVHRFKQANIYSFFLECGISIPAVFILVHYFGGRGALMARPFTAFFALLFALFYVLRQYGDTFLDKALLLSKDFGFAAGKELELTVESLEEVMMMSRLASMFAEENGVDENSVYFLGLAIEEMAGNIIQHGFVEGNENYIDIRILVKEDEVILRIRDNCKPFNPMEQYEILKDARDPMKNMGIRMIVKMAKDVVYLNTMNTNNLIIHV